MKNNYTLVIMAAGLGSRFKGGTKQLEAIGPNGETIMDYSIYDAYQAGFNKVVLIIREEFEENIKNHFQNRLPNDLKLELVFQHITDIPNNFNFKERKKPWGTGQAILLCKNIINEPFVVINADDYYGKEAFINAYEFFKNNNDEFYMAGFILDNTLSEYGTVNRGVTKVDNNNNLLDIEETFNLEKRLDIITGININNEEVIIDKDLYASMNFFGFTPLIFNFLETKFNQFLSSLRDESKDEFLLPTVVKEMIKENLVNVKVIKTNDKWFGITYYEDKIIASKKIKEYINKGYFSEKLF